MYESLIALQKINDPSVGPRVSFLLRDLEEKVQIAALETVGLLRTHEAAAGIRDALDHARNIKVRRAAASSLAMLGEAPDKAAFLAMLQDKDDDIRSAGAEGLGRIKDPSVKPQRDAALTAEKKTGPRLAGAFAISSLGNYDVAEFAPFRYLVHSLNLKSYRNVANAYLTELLRDPAARAAVYPLLAGPTLNGASKDERIQLASILGKSGGKDSESYLDQLSRDPDTDVAQEGVRALRLLRTRL